MNTFKKLSISDDKIIKDEELVNLRGGEEELVCICTDLAEMLIHNTWCCVGTVYGDGDCNQLCNDAFGKYAYGERGFAHYCSPCCEDL